MKLSHYSDDRLGDLINRPWPERGERGSQLFAWKPLGLWVSVDGPDDWKAWCTSNQFALHRLSNRYRITLRDSWEKCTVLHLSTAQALRAFESDYGRSDGITSFPAIDWWAVKDKYAGIIIAPYQWSCRLDLMWYYGWDCASGCIWDVSVIKQVRRLKS